MASLKEIKGRIASIQNTQKITSAMRMVASAKLHRAQGMTEKFLRYRDSLQSIVESLGGQTLPSPIPEQSSPFPTGKGRRRSGSIVLVPISSNSGLCGAFNSNIAKATFKRMNELQSQGIQVKPLPIGKKITHELKKADIDCNLVYFNLLEKIEKGGDLVEVDFLMEFALQLYQSGEIDGIEFIYHHFKSMGSQIITITPIPLEAPTIQEKEDDTFLTEPSPVELLASLFPRLLNAQTYGILLDSLASEHAARMMAMQTADDNANELLKELTLLYNKTRQQAITNELIDIMGGQTEKR